MLVDYLLIAVRNLLSRRTRTLLTVIGIFIGIAAIVSLVSLGRGFQGAITEEFNKVGADKVMIQSGRRLTSALVVSSRLTDRDLEIVRSVPGVKEAGGMVYGIAGMRFKDRFKYSWYMGYPTDSSKRVLESMASIELADGRELRQNDRFGVLVGREFYNGNFFGEEVKLGSRLEINGQAFRVQGFFKPIGNPQDDSSVIMPLDTARELFARGNAIDSIVAQAQPEVNPEELAERIKKTLRRARGLREGEEDFSVYTTAQLITTLNVVLDVVQIVFIGIAAISLVVGGVGIMNTMYTAVMERTSEIGTMKAVGAKNSDILIIFLIESGLLGLAGGTLGILFGVTLSKGIEIAARSALAVDYFRTSFPLALVLGSLAFSFLIGAFSGTLPAYRASRLSPVDALRYE